MPQMHSPTKRPRISVLLEFDAPRIAFSEIREFIIYELESAGGRRHPSDPLFHSLANVRVSKPIVLWRDPRSPPKAKIITLVSPAEK